jgi:hypothetical protein
MKYPVFPDRPTRGKRNVARGKKFGAPGGSTFLPSSYDPSKNGSRALTHFTSRVRCDLSTDTSTLPKLWVPKPRWANRGNRYYYEVLKRHMGITISDLGELLEFRGVGRGLPQRPKGGLKVLPRPSVLDSGHSPRCREALYRECGVVVKFP